MPTLNAKNNVDLKQNKYLNRNRRLSVGVIMQLAAMDDSLKKSAMQYSLTRQQQAYAEKSIVQFKLSNAALAKMLKPVSSYFDKVNALTEPRRLSLKFPPVQVPVELYSLEPDNRSDIAALERRLVAMEKSLESVGPSKRHRPRIKLVSKDYDPIRNVLNVGHKTVTFGRAPKEAIVLTILFDNPRRLRRAWDFDEFIEKHKKQLSDSRFGITKSSHIRSAVGRINTKVSKDTHEIFDLFLIERGFRVNPKYLSS